MNARIRLTFVSPLNPDYVAVRSAATRFHDQNGTSEWREFFFLGFQTLLHAQTYFFKTIGKEFVA